jgi:hypothetical protein
MSGVITSRDVLIHGLTIVRLWGPRVYLRCLHALVRHRPTTFLSVACGETLKGSSSGPSAA